MPFSIHTYNRVYAIVRTVAIASLILLLLSSCSVNRQLNKQSVSAATESNVTTTVTERFDTTITIKPDSVSGSLSIADLLKGKELLEDNGSSVLQLRYDTLTKKIVATAVRKAVSVPVQIHKTTTTHASVKTLTKTQSKLKTSQTSAGFKTENLGLILAIILLLFLWYIAAGFKKKKPEGQ